MNLRQALEQKVGAWKHERGDLYYASQELDGILKMYPESEPEPVRPAPDREEAIERLYEHTRKAEQRDRASLDAKNWNGSLMPLVPEDVLRTHCAAVVDIVLGTYEERDESNLHLSGWAPGNLQSHLIHDHNVPPSEAMYDAPLDEIHARLHAKEAE